MPCEQKDTCFRIDESSTIWRYMNLDKFYDMLRRKAIFFCRDDKFPDKHEGSVPRRVIEDRKLEYMRICDFYQDPISPKKAEEFDRTMRDAHIKLRQRTIVNCWHINNNENDSMWNLYLGKEKGVSIRSSVQRLLNAFKETKEDILCSGIKYIDYDKDLWYSPNGRTAYNFILPFIHKKIEFKQESELRLIYSINSEYHHHPENFWVLQEFSEGLHLKANIEEVVENVYLSPNCIITDLSEVKEKSISLGYNFDFQISNLSKEPTF